MTARIFFQKQGCRQTPRIRVKKKKKRKAAPHITRNLTRAQNMLRMFLHPLAP